MIYGKYDTNSIHFFSCDTISLNSFINRSLRKSQSQLEHLGLQSPLEEILWFEGQNVVKLHLVLRQNSSPHQTTEQSISLKQSPGIFLLQSEELPGGCPDLGQSVLDSPDLSLVPQAELSHQLQLLVKSGLLERSPGSCISLPIVLGNLPVDHAVTLTLSQALL